MGESVILVSGGFDSVTLLHDLYDKGERLSALFFDYGQISRKREEECSLYNCEILNIPWMKIKLPKLVWTESNFYGEGVKDTKSQYLEMRNLIFLSYALSYAESIKASKIYAAFLYPSPQWYSDSTLLFAQNFNKMSYESLGIELITPYIQYGKNQVAEIARKLLNVSYFHSCDTPKPNGDPCGKCFDCLMLKDLRF